MKLNDVLKTLRKSTNSTTAKNSDISTVTEYYDTGSLALNRCITGDITKGVPRGRITTFFGESGSGKSMLCGLTVATALKNKQIDRVWWVDSEGGGINILESLGVDLDLVEYVPVTDIEDASVKMINIFETLMQARQEWLKDPNNNDEVKAIVVLDSFGALASSKMISDATEKDKVVADMGISAKMKNALIKSLMMRVVVSNTSLLVVSHTYKDTNSLFTSKVQKLSGGMGLEYSSHLIIQATKLLIKETDTDYLTGKERTESDVGFFKGNRMKFFCIKNRICKPGHECSVYIDFDTGISRYDGLISDAVKYGFLQEVRGGYMCPSYSDKRINYKELVSNDKIWNTFINEFNEKSMKLMSYRTDVEDELGEIDNELNNEE